MLYLKEVQNNLDMSRYGQVAQIWRETASGGRGRGSEYFKILIDGLSVRPEGRI